MKKMFVLSLLITQGLFAITAKGALAEEVSLNCQPAFETFFGGSCRFGCKQENDWQAISITVDPSSKTLSKDGWHDVPFYNTGNRVEFFLSAHDGALEYIYELDTVTGSLEVTLRAKAGVPEDYNDVDIRGFATIQKNFFLCQTVKKLF